MDELNHMMQVCVLFSFLLCFFFKTQKFFVLSERVFCFVRLVWSEKCRAGA